MFLNVLYQDVNNKTGFYFDFIVVQYNISNQI